MSAEGLYAALDAHAAAVNAASDTDARATIAWEDRWAAIRELGRLADEHLADVLALRAKAERLGVLP